MLLHNFTESSSSILLLLVVVVTTRTYGPGGMVYVSRRAIYQHGPADLILLLHQPQLVSPVSRSSSFRYPFADGGWYYGCYGGTRDKSSTSILLLLCCCLVGRSVGRLSGVTPIVFLCVIGDCAATDNDYPLELP